MRKKWMAILALSILLTALAITSLILYLMDQELDRQIEAQQQQVVETFQKRVRFLDEMMRKVEVRMEADLDQAFQRLIPKLIHQGKPVSFSLQDLKTLALQEQVEIFFVRQDGVVFQTSYEPEQNFNIFTGSVTAQKHFNSIFGSGKIVHQRYSYSKKTGEKFKFSQFSPKGAHFALELGIRIQTYIEKHYSPEYYRLLFFQLFLSLIRQESLIKEIDVYGQNSFYSILYPGKRLSKNLQEEIASQHRILIQNPKERILYFALSTEKAHEEPREFVLELRFDLSEKFQIREKLLLYSLGAALGIGILILLTAAWLLRKQIFNRLELINQKLRQVAEGNYWEENKIEGNDELSRMGETIDSMKKRIQEREEQLKHFNDQLEEANKIKSQFIANVNHELRTPMTGIVGMIQLLALSPLTDEQKEYLEIIQISSDNLLKIIKDILDFSELQKNGRLDSKLEEFSLSGLLDEVFQRFQMKGEKKGLKSELMISPKLPECFLGHPYLIKQILIHLLDNAVKFTENGQFFLSAQEGIKTARIQRIHIKVCDTGIGIDLNNISSIYDSFHQIDFTDTRRYGGLGLGLTIAKRLTESLKGSLSVESQPQRGSCFHLDIPLEIPVHPIPESSEISSENKVDKKTLHILVVENETSNLEVFRRLILAKGWTLDAAENGFEALEKFAHHHYDLILMDIQMPEMDGFETVHHIRQKEITGSTHVPIIAVTAFYMPGYEKLCRMEGMDGYLEKPIEMDRFYSLILEVTSQDS